MNYQQTIRFKISSVLIHPGVETLGFSQTTCINFEYQIAIFEHFEFNRLVNEEKKRTLESPFH